jgi:hypothetical protein
MMTKVGVKIAVKMLKMGETRQPQRDKQRQWFDQFVGKRNV